MKRWAFLFALLLAIPVSAAEPGFYPSTLIDANCEDDDGSTVTGNQTFVHGTSTRTTESSGAANGLCDNDNRILTGAQVADVVLGPFEPGESGQAWISTNGTAVSGGTTTWTLCIGVDRPEEAPATPPLAADLKLIACGAVSTGNVDVWYHVGSAGVAVSVANSTTATLLATMSLPKRFYLLLDLAGGVGSSATTQATSWAGSISMFYTN